MVNLLVAAALAAASPAIAPAAPQASADPAMFVVGDADTTVYIFGTFHALDGQSNWFDSKIRNAFEDSNELVLETLVPEGPTPFVGHPLPASPVAPSASFLATTRMAINAGRSQGMQVDNGADMVLRRVAEHEGKLVSGLETLDSQLTMFQKMPATERPAGSQAGAPAKANPMQDLSKAMTDMQSAWKRGDQAVFVQVLGQLEQTSPQTYRMLFTERNTRWADWIAARLQQPGTVFVAVGAGHLAGKDSVLVRLAQLGIQSRRVNPQSQPQP
jgi:uncharacterized protein YbaP (TraB family)